MKYTSSSHSLLAIAVATTSIIDLPPTMVHGQPTPRSSFSRAQQPPITGYEACAVNEESVEFVFFSDARSFVDNGWTLECAPGMDQPGTIDSTSTSRQSILTGQGNPDQETIWNVPIGSLKYDPGHSSGLLRSRTCIPDDWTCTFTLWDNASNGLMAPYPDSSLSEGWYLLRYGARTIATYQQQPFEQLDYCVGAGCSLEDYSQTPSLPASDEPCKVTHLAITLDNRPEDFSYTVTCTNGIDALTIWEGAGFGSDDAGRTIEHESCLPAAFCCSLIVVDATGDGLTDPVTTEFGLKYGSIHLEWDEEPTLDYEGEDDPLGFEDMIKTFGRTCIDEDLTIDINNPGAGVNPLTPPGGDMGGIVFAEEGGGSSSRLSQQGKISLILCMVLLGIALIVVGYICWRRRDRKEVDTGAPPKGGAAAQDELALANQKDDYDSDGSDEIFYKI